MVGFICYGLMGVSLMVAGNMMLGCAALVGASVWLMTMPVDGEGDE